MLLAMIFCYNVVTFRTFKVSRYLSATVNCFVEYAICARANPTGFSLFCIDHTVCQLPLSFVLVCMSTTCLPDQIRMIGTFAMPVMRLTVAIMPFFPCGYSTAKLSSDFPGINQEFVDKWPAIVSFLMRALSVIELLFIV